MLRSPPAPVKMYQGMDKGRHPKVVRTWMADKIRKATAKVTQAQAVPHRPAPHNKT